MLITQTIKNIRRAREMARILIKYGFEEVVVNTPLQNLVSQRSQLSWAHGGDASVFELNTWERVRMVFEELGATFVKGAQVLSNRPEPIARSPNHRVSKTTKQRSSI